MSAASVLKKTLERIIGTFLGSSLALLVGYMTTRFSNKVHHQAMIMGSCIFLISFPVSFAVVENPSLSKHPYAALLVLLTFGIVGFPFYNSNSDDDVWLKCIYRVVNIVIGCILSAIMAVLVHPKPTYRAIQESLAQQVASAGEASKEVLQSAVQVFSNQSLPIPLRDKVLLDQIPEIDHGDKVLKLTKQGMGDFYHAKKLYPLLPFDAFYLHRTRQDPRERSLFESETQMCMYRAFRIHAIVQLINAIIHNDTGHDFTPEHLALFDRASHLIPLILTDKFNDDKEEDQPLLTQDPCALELCNILAEIRQHALQAAEDLAQRRRSGIGTKASRDPSDFLKDLRGFTMPPNPSATLLFLELVENLILRLLRLHTTLMLQGTTLTCEENAAITASEHFQQLSRVTSKMSLDAYNEDTAIIDGTK